MRVGDILFAHRGGFLGVAAAVLIAVGTPSATSVVQGSLLALVGLSLRLWAISWIGPAARTRDPAPPAARVVGGPYRVRHPLYLANVLAGTGLTIACRPSLTVLTVTLFGLVGFYALLAWREETDLRRVAPGVLPRLSWIRALRTERSTWATAVIALGATALRVS